MKQKEIIIRYLQECNGWVMEGKIRSLDTKWGFIGFRGDRTVREMKASGLLEWRKNGKYAEVRAKPTIQLPPPFKVEPKKSLTQQLI